MAELADAKVSKTFGITSRVGSIPTIPTIWSPMKKSAVTFESIPSAAISSTVLSICLKCAFDVFTKQLKLAPRTAYSELKKHVPADAEFTGTLTSRPHFFENPETDRCPYCDCTKRWFAHFQELRIDAHPEFEKDRKKLWAALRKDPDRYVLRNPSRTQFEIFSDWLERLKRTIDLEAEDWLMVTALEQIRRANLSADWRQPLREGVKRVQLSRDTSSWRYENGWLYVSPAIYGDVLLIQHLLSRSHLHGGLTFEGRLTLPELVRRLRRIGYFEARGIDSHDSSEAFEQAIVAMVASGPAAVYYAVDRGPYLDKLKAIYEKKRDKS